jgi:hypothetical protein
VEGEDENEEEKEGPRRRGWREKTTFHFTMLMFPSKGALGRGTQARRARTYADKLEAEETVVNCVEAPLGSDVANGDPRHRQVRLHVPDLHYEGVRAIILHPAPASPPSPTFPSHRLPALPPLPQLRLQVHQPLYSVPGEREPSNLHLFPSYVNVCPSPRLIRQLGEFSHTSLLFHSGSSHIYAPQSCVVLWRKRRSQAV